MTNEEFQNWKSSSLTQEVFKFIEELKAQHTQFLLKGGTLDKNVTMTPKVIGIIEGLDSLLSITFNATGNESPDSAIKGMKQEQAASE